MKSLWLEDIISGSLGTSLFARILEKISATLWMRLIGLKSPTRSVALFSGGGLYVGRVNQV
jgi:hypothetical protein